MSTLQAFVATARRRSSSKRRSSCRREYWLENKVLAVKQWEVVDSPL